MHKITAKINKIKYISVCLQHKYLISITLLLTTLIVSGCSSSSKESQASPNLPIEDNLVLHLKADTGVAIEKGKVVGWIDNSLMGNNLSGAGDPILKADGINDRPTLYFDGKGDKLEQTLLGLQGLPTGNDDRTVFMVAKYNSNGFGGFAYGNAANNNAFGLVVDNEGYLAVQGWGQNNDRLTKVDGNGSDWLTQSAKLEVGILTQYKNGVQLNSTAHNYNTTAEQLVVGAEIGNRNYVEMEIAEIIVFDLALDEDKRKQVESYLQQKYF